MSPLHEPILQINSADGQSLFGPLRGSSTREFILCYPCEYEDLYLQERISGESVAAGGADLPPGTMPGDFRMETVEHFSDFLRNIGAPNFLAIGIVVIVAWLLFSGLVKGLRKRRRDNKDEDGED